MEWMGLCRHSKFFSSRGLPMWLPDESERELGDDTASWVGGRSTCAAACLPSEVAQCLGMFGIKQGASFAVSPPCGSKSRSILRKFELGPWR